MESLRSRAWFVFTLSVIFFGSGCGGGTSGSGLHSYSGTVSDTGGRGISGVSVTIESTGDHADTDAAGGFVIHSEAFGGEVPFLLEAPDFVSRFSLKEIPESSFHVSVDVTVDTMTDLVEVKNISVRAWFAGLCDRYFENREVIRQANQVPAGTICSLNVEVLGDGRRLSQVPVSLEYASCDEGAVWQVVKEVSTGSGAHAGSVEINFPFESSETHCRYRVVVPSAPSNVLPRAVHYPIDTFAEQEAFAAK